MLSAKDIHFLIEQDLNAGAFVNRGYEGEELDEAINATVFRLLNETLTKFQEQDDKKVVLENNERILLRELTKSFCSIPVDNEVVLPNDYLAKISAETTIYQLDCGRKIAKDINDKMVLQAGGSVKYNGVWYQNDEIFAGQDQTKSRYGLIYELVSKKKNSVFIDETLFNSFISTSSTSFYTIIGNKIQIKSKFPIAKFCFNYIGNEEFKMDSCTDKTLNLSETLQRWVIDRTVLRLASRNEESQQKIENFKQL